MISATIEMLRARREEHVAYVGVVAGLFCDDLSEAVVRLENVREAAREYEHTLDPRRQKRARLIARDIAEVADELLPGIRQVAKGSKDA